MKAVAGALSEGVRHPPDLVARYGGEEFACVLPHETLDGAKTVAQRMLDRVRAMVIPHIHSPSADHVTVSLGIAVLTPSRDALPTSLIAAADAKLYQAKAAGRNRIAADETP